MSSIMVGETAALLHSLLLAAAWPVRAPGFGLSAPPWCGSRLQDALLPSTSPVHVHKIRTGGRAACS